MDDHRLAIEALGLTKVYGTLMAVHALDFSVEVGEVFGFLGPNGAGKTSTIRMLTTLSRPTAGEARVFGHDVFTAATSVKAAIGVVPEESSLYDDLSVWDNLLFAGHLYGVPEADLRRRSNELIARLGLEDKRDASFESLSKGLRRRATIAAALVHQPTLLFLDEPTTGLDVFSARELRRLVQDLNSQGMTVFLTTHNIEEAAALCHRVAFIVKGKIVALDTPQALRSLDTSRATLEVGFEPLPPALAAAMGELSADGVVQTGALLRFVPKTLPVALQEVGRLAQRFGAEISHCRTVEPSLEDVFVQLTGVERETMREDKERGESRG